MSSALARTVNFWHSLIPTSLPTPGLPLCLTHIVQHTGSIFKPIFFQMKILGTV
jgi:hypothetical protein